MAVKILRQSQAAGGKVLKQNELAGGKIVKQNYNFGKAWHCRSVSPLYIKCNYKIGFNATIGGYCSVTAAQATNPLHFDIDNTNTGLSTITANPRAIFNGSIARQYDLININAGVLHFYAGLIIDGAIHSYARDSRIETRSLDVASKIGVHDLILAKPGINTPNVKYYDFFVFSRVITANERLHFHNKYLGNEPLSLMGLDIWYKNEQAEILDFSIAQDGSDIRVGLRNFGSIIHAHGEIVGTPAGTLAEKRDWVNANYIVL